MISETVADLLSICWAHFVNGVLNNIKAVVCDNPPKSGRRADAFPGSRADVDARLEFATSFQGFEDGGSILASSRTASRSSDCASCAYVVATFVKLGLKVVSQGREDAALDDVLRMPPKLGGAWGCGSGVEGPVGQAGVGEVGCCRQRPSPSSHPFSPREQPGFPLWRTLYVLSG